MTSREFWSLMVASALHFGAAGLFVGVAFHLGDNGVALAVAGAIFGVGLNLVVNYSAWD